jgi:crotonobetainyl-CoA:carnitine CoA-transferase CaiB-like acyl-CoA transferase
MLEPYRVLDLTDNRAALGPIILGDLGAGVVKVEPPGGSPERADETRFAAFNRNKRSVTLDLDADGGHNAFLELVAGTDLLFENQPPGAMAARGLGFDDLRAANPQLVYVAVSPFGQDGPYAGHAATDLTLAAMGGMMAVNGDPDRPPIRISVPQTWLHAATESAVAALVALQRRLQTGEAQFVDVSAQAAVFWTLMNAQIAYAVQGSDMERSGGIPTVGPARVPSYYRCADGYVYMSLALLGTLAGIVPAMVAEGIAPESWPAEDWATYFERLRAGGPVAIDATDVVSRVQAFTLRHTRQELLAAGMEAGVSLAPVDTIADVLALEQLQARRYWQALRLPSGKEVRAPGPFVRFRGQVSLDHLSVPLPGESNEALEQISRHRANPLLGSFPQTEGRLSLSQVGEGEGESEARAPALPFAGLKVADFSWVAVGPSTAKYLADHGATTVHIESALHPDVLRRGQPFKDGVPGLNRSQYFGAYNTSKQSIALDLRHPAGHEVALRLLAWADVCIESFTPGTMARLGLDEPVARALNPSLIWVSTCLMGQTGPLAPFGGFGYHAAALAGFSEVTGWPDRPPSGPFVAYTDTMANRFLAATIMAALDHRRRTGEGQYIEQAQMESALHFLAPEILEYQTTGTLPTRRGNDSSFAAPHNAYPCLGQDQWCAIAVETDAQWLALRAAMGDPAWARDPALTTVEGRIARRAELDAHLADWTREQDRYALMDRLQAAGVPAGVVQRSSDLMRDPQLAHRRFFRPLAHPEMGEVPYEGHQFRIRGYDSGPRSPAPALGEHNFEVLHDILGLSDEQIAEIAASGALA